MWWFCTHSHYKKVTRVVVMFCLLAVVNILIAFRHLHTFTGKLWLAEMKVHILYSCESFDENDWLCLYAFFFLLIFWKIANPKSIYNQIFQRLIVKIQHFIAVLKFGLSKWLSRHEKLLVLVQTWEIAGLMLRFHTVQYC